MSDLGACLVKQGSYAEAEILLVQSYEGFRSLEREWPGLALTIQRLVELYESWRRPETASHYRAELANGR
jgi:hypothetical protein